MWEQESLPFDSERVSGWFCKSERTREVLKQPSQPSITQPCGIVSITSASLQIWDGVRWIALWLTSVVWGLRLCWNINPWEESLCHLAWSKVGVAWMLPKVCYSTHDYSQAFYDLYFHLLPDSFQGTTVWVSLLERGHPPRGYALPVVTTTQSLCSESTASSCRLRALLTHSRSVGICAQSILHTIHSSGEPSLDRQLINKSCMITAYMITSLWKWLNCTRW